MTYATLKTEVANYLHRSDLTAQIPTFIATAEAYLFRELVVKELQTSAVLTSAGEYVTLPTDFSSINRLTVTVGGIERTLDYKSKVDNYTVTSGVPSSFSLENNQLRLWGAGTGTKCTLYYTPKIENLSDTVTTNWILDNARDLYLYASALEGARYVRNMAQAESLTGLVAMSLDSVRKFAERRGIPTVASLQIKVAR